MLPVLLAISVAIAIFCLLFWGLYIQDYDSLTFGFIIVIDTVVVIGLTIATIVMGISVSNERALYEKIKIYEEENTKLEQQINTAVKAYILHEEKYAEIYKNESSIVLIQVVPELKSNELVMKQFEILQQNNEQIKNEKKKIANLTTEKWWLYFGH